MADEFAASADVVLISTRAARHYGHRLTESAARGFVQKQDLTGDAFAALPVWPRGPRLMRVVIAEDVVLLREGLARLLGDAGVQVLAAVSTPDDALRAVAQHRPDVLLVDVRMPPTQDR